MVAVGVMPYEKMFLIDEAEYMKINKLQYPDPNTASMTTDDDDDGGGGGGDDTIRASTVTDSHESIDMSGGDGSRIIRGPRHHDSAAGRLRGNDISDESSPRKKRHVSFPDGGKHGGDRNVNVATRQPPPTTI